MFCRRRNDVSFKGIQLAPDPVIVLKPSFVCCPAECKMGVVIYGTSSLVMSGSGLVTGNYDESSKIISMVVIVFRRIVPKRFYIKKMELVKQRPLIMKKLNLLKLQPKILSCQSPLCCRKDYRRRSHRYRNDREGQYIPRRKPHGNDQITALNAEAKRIAEKQAQIKKEIAEELEKTKQEEARILTKTAESQRLDE